MGTPPPPPPPQLFHTTPCCKAAIAAFDKGNFVKALRELRNRKSLYIRCPIYHHSVAFILHKIAFLNKDCDSLEGAVTSARQATILCPNSIHLAYFYACSLFDLTSYNEEYDEVITECSRALKISIPDPKRNSYIFKDLSQHWGTERIKQKLIELIEQCQRRRKWVVASSGLTIEEYEEAERGRLDRIRERLAGLRDSQGRMLIKPSVANFVKAKKAEDVWINEMSDEQKLSFLEVKVKDLEEHVTDQKAKDLLLEAIDCVEKWGAWTCWFCCEDSNKFGGWESFMLHLYDFHNLKVWDDIVSVCLPVVVDERSRQMIVSDDWKPLDIEAAIRIMENPSRLESHNTDESGMRAEKGQDEHKDCSDEDVQLMKQVDCENGKEVSLTASTEVLNWPLSDDNKRMTLLANLRGTLQLLLAHNYLHQDDVDGVIRDIVCMLRTRFSDSQLGSLGQNALKMVCLLESSQLQSIIYKLQNVCSVSNENTGMCNSTEEQLNGARTSDLKMEVLLKGNSLYLALDGKLAVHDDVVPWLYVGHEVGEALKLWASLRESTKRQVVQLFESFEIERSKIYIIYEKRLQNLQKLEALGAVDGICGDETLRRKENPDYVRKSFASLLRERQKELEERIDDAATANPFELDFILNVLETDQSVTAYQFEIMDSLNESDEYLRQKILSWRNKLEFDIRLLDANVMGSMARMKLFKLQIGQISSIDYHVFVLPVLKSFVKEQLERVFLPMLPLDNAKNYMVINNIEEIDDFKHSLYHCKVISIDCEWDKRRKEFVEIDGKRYNFNPLELLQMCILTGDNVEDSVIYILDMRQILSKEIRDLLTDILQAEHVLKLGFDCHNDIKNLNLTLTYNGLAECNKISPFVDAYKIYELLNEGKCLKQRPGLAQVCEELLHVKVPKDQQQSNWADRPISDDQFIYAATDVYCVMLIFCRFREQVEIQQLSEDLSFSVFKKHNRSIKKEEEKKCVKKQQQRVDGKEQIEKLSYEYKPPPPWDESIGGNEEAKFLCHPSQQGIIKALKGRGIDIISDKSNDPQYLKEMSDIQQRVILTRDRGLFDARLGLAGRVYLLEEDKKKSDQVTQFVYGVLDVQRVAENFHISVHGLNNYVAQMIFGGTKDVNVSHVIHDLSFGPKYPGIHNPLDETVRTLHDTSGTFKYYIKIVPTEYRYISKDVLPTNQFSVTEYFSTINEFERTWPGMLDRWMYRLLEALTKPRARSVLR